jgi:hypothetical protein
LGTFPQARPHWAPSTQRPKVEVFGGSTTGGLGRSGPARPVAVPILGNRGSVQATPLPSPGIGDGSANRAKPGRARVRWKELVAKTGGTTGRRVAKVEWVGEPAR